MYEIISLVIVFRENRTETNEVVWLPASNQVVVARLPNREKKKEKKKKSGTSATECLWRTSGVQQKGREKKKAAVSAKRSMTLWTSLAWLKVVPSRVCHLVT